MVKPRWPVLAALLLLAALLAALPGAASAQTPPTWDEDGVLELTPPNTIENIGGYRCARWDAGAPSTDLTYLNFTAPLYGICAGVTTVLYLYLYFAPDVDQVRLRDTDFSSLRFKVGASTGAAYLFDPIPSTGGFDEENTTFADQTTLRVKTPAYTLCSNSNVICNVNAILATGDTATIEFAVSGDLLLQGTPGTPDMVTATRNSDYSEATLTWNLFDPVSKYEIHRRTAVTVQVGDSVRIEYGDGVFFSIDGTIEGVDTYVDDTVDPDKTYQYRVRARGAAWSSWSAYVFSGMKPWLDLDAPANVELSRTHENSQVTVSWTAPEGDFDNYTLQRQELAVVEGSTIFANAVTLGGAGWLPGNTTTYTDDSFLPGRTYEYRVAAVKDGLIGDYSDWSRSSPVQTSLGVAPENFRFVSGNGSRLLDRRREFWMRWDEVDGADDYEVGVLVYNVATGGQAMENYIVTDPTYFRTSYGRVEVRVRGRKSDDTLCGDSDGTVETGEDCYSEWTGWYGVNFTPKATVAAPPLVDDTADASIMELRADTEEVIESSLAAAGAPVDAGLVVQFLTLVAATVIGGISVALGWRLGMAPLGVGMGAAIAILILFTGYRLFGVPLAWPVSIQAALAVAGLFAAVRQTGVFR